MIFTYTQAEKIIENHKDLIGQFLDNPKSILITDIYIFPSEKKLHYDFFAAKHLFTDNKTHLLKFCVDLNSVEIYLYNFNIDNPTNPIKLEIDKYLTDYNILKKYS